MSTQGRVGGAGQAVDPPARLARAGTGDRKRGDVVARERVGDPAGELLRVLGEVAVHAGGEAVVHVARVLLQLGIDLHRPPVVRLTPEVRVERRAALVQRQLAACAQQPARHALAIIFNLQVPQRVAERLEGVGVDVRHPVGRAEHLDLRRQGVGDAALCARRWRPG